MDGLDGAKPGLAGRGGAGFQKRAGDRKGSPRPGAVPPLRPARASDRVRHALTGRFNAHLRDACLLFADEAYWPGDKGAEGSLKRLITEPELFIEGKGRDGVMVENRLHVIIASRAC